MIALRNLTHRNLIILIAFIVCVVCIFSLYSSSLPTGVLGSQGDDGSQNKELGTAYNAGVVPSPYGYHGVATKTDNKGDANQATKGDPTPRRGKFKYRAAVYARPTFHEEVVSTIACMLYDAGMEVNVYIGSGVSYGMLTLPLSQQRMHNSDMFFGKCVHKWIPITDPLLPSTYLTDLDLLVFTTYPIHTHGFVPDPAGFSLLEDIHKKKAPTRVVLITHRTNETLHETLPMVEKYLPNRTQFTFAFLAEHTMRTGQQTLIDNNKSVLAIQTSTKGYTTDGTGTVSAIKSTLNRIKETIFPTTKGDYQMGVTPQGLKYKLYVNKESNEGMYRVSHFIPVFPMKYIGAYPSSSHHVTSFVHTYIEDYYHRNNNNEDIMVKEGDNNEHENDQGLKNDNDAIAAEFNHKYLYDPSTQRQLFSIQGNFGGRHAHRKNIRGTSDCLRNLQLGVGSNGSSLNNKAFNNPSSIELHLIGHVQGDKNDLDIGSLPKEKVIFHSDLNSIQYYRALAQQRFLIVAVGETDYYCCKATSSVPAALITGTPLIMPKEFLSFYPCLRQQPIHARISKETECESIAAALSLNDDDYLAMRREVNYCAGAFYQEAMSLFTSLASEAQTSRR